ncbi:MAG: hypothetical protein ABIW96_08420 [Polaromonas sp.]
MSSPLKAGTVDNFTSSLAAYIDKAMQNEWQARKGESLPDTGQGAEDRKILFAAIAQGVMKFLADHVGDLVTTDNSGDGGLTNHHHTMAFKVDTYRTPLP